MECLSHFTQNRRTEAPAIDAHQLSLSWGWVSFPKYYVNKDCLCHLATCFPTLQCKKRKGKNGTGGWGAARPNPVSDFSPERRSNAQRLLPIKGCLQVNLHFLIITWQSHIFKVLGSVCVRQYLSHRQYWVCKEGNRLLMVAGRLAGQ